MAPSTADAQVKIKHREHEWRDLAKNLVNGSRMVSGVCDRSIMEWRVEVTEIALCGE